MNKPLYDYDVFISYARHDGEIDDRVMALVDILKEKARNRSSKDLKVFIDVEGIPYGEAFDNVIFQALTRSQILVAVVTESYLRSKYCQLEFEAFEKQTKKDSRKKIVPILWNNNGIQTRSETDFYEKLFLLNMANFTKPHPVRKEIKKSKLTEDVNMSIDILVNRIIDVLNIT